VKPVEALQAGLAGEHAAVYLYEVLGARTSRSRTPQLFSDVDAAFRLHRRQRDNLSRRIVDRGADPVAAEVSYQLPGRILTPADVEEAALLVERRLASVYGQLVGSTSGSDRRWGLGALDSCAVRQLAFRGTPEMFPGTTP
jgi:hypothetical protein